MKITKRDKEILDCIISYIQKHGYPPSYTEIGEMAGIKSRSSVYLHMHKLLAAGCIETDAETNVPRAIRIPGWKFVREE